MKQETLEEAAMSYLDRTYSLSYERTTWQKLHEKTFAAGAKWQAERMYSEAEVKSAFKIGFNIGYGSPVQELDFKNEHCEKWFKQFKKK